MENWTAEVLSSTKTNNDFSVEVLMVGDQGHKMVTTFRVRSNEELKSLVRSATSTVEFVASETIVIGPLDFKLPPAVVPPPDPEKDKFFADYSLERTDQVLATLTPELQARYKPEYGPLR